MRFRQLFQNVAMLRTVGDCQNKNKVAKMKTKDLNQYCKQPRVTLISFWVSSDNFGSQNDFFQK